MNCIAIDDEPLALNVISDFCAKVDFLDLIEVFTSAVEAVESLNSKQIDLIFLDIQMPHLSGLDFIKTLTNPPIIIFTTAYSEHAVEGFELNAIDYLVKPIPFDRFFQATNKAYELYKLRKQDKQHSTKNKDDSYMLVKAEYSTVKVNYHDIQYIEGLKDYVKIYIDDKTVLTKTTMKKLEEKLPADNFIRVHKSFIVSISKIEKIEKNRIIFKGKRIPVGEHYKDAFYQKIDKYKL